MEVYDYSQHRYCLAIHLGYDLVSSGAVAMNKSIRKVERCREYSTSILYDTITRNIIARGSKADEANENPKRLQEGVIYVRNTLSELTDIYLKSKQQSFDDIALYEEAIDLLQELLYDYKQELNSVNMDFYYSLNIPTSWDYKIRDELFLPLFVKAGLIHENDNPGRLVFFSMLELNFERILIHTGLHRGSKIKHNDQRVMCTIEYQDAYSVDLKLVSAQYPAFRLAKEDLVPQLLKQAHFVIPFGLKELRLSLIACVEKHCYATLSSETIDDMLKKINQKYNGYKDFETIRDKLYDRPLPGFKSRWTNRSITLGDILEHFSGSAEKVLRNEVDKFLVGTSNTVPRPMDVFYTSRIPNNFLTVGIILSMDHWSEKYFWELGKSYSYAELGDNFRIFELFDYRVRRDAVIQLLENGMEEFNLRRNPIILPKETTMEVPKSCLKSIIFINIDISSTQIKTVFTYLDIGRKIGQKQNFECNMQPLNNFIKQSELYRRPILQMPNRLKLGLEKIFGDHLKIYSNYKRQSMIRRILVNPTSKLFNQTFQKMRKRRALSSDGKIKSSKKIRQKEIRNLFISSNPNLFEQLTPNLEVDDLFVSKDKFGDANSEPFTTCHPGYIYFFMLTYLYCLKKQIEEKLESDVGKNWQAHNIWYAVSIKKNQLDTVFGSIKNLEKSFFASGILEKNDELRKAKFCTRGEEILPAIQHKYPYLDFRLKSHFVVAQISSKHLQLSLHQVVKLASPGKDPASIIIQDEMIHIDDGYDTLCKNIIKSFQVNCQVDYCTKHKDEEDTQYDFQSFEIYNNIFRNLKPCVVKLLDKNKANMDMNSKIHLNISTKCGCSISIFLRDIIEVGLTSVIESITANIVASLTNKRLFGNYVPNYIFVFGDPFNLAQGSKIHIAYTMIMQKAIIDGIYIKEKDTKTFVLRESIFQLLEPLVPKKKPYIFDRFVTGTLCRVSSETYALRIGPQYKNIYDAFTRINSDGDIKDTIADDGSYLVLIQKGKPVPTKGLMLQVNDRIYITLKILQLENSTSPVPDKYALLHGDTHGVTYKIESLALSYDYISTFVVEYEQIQNSLSIKVSSDFKGDIDDYINYTYYATLKFTDPLTLAYI